MFKITLTVLALLVPLTSFAYEDEYPFGSPQFQNELRTREKASWINLHTRVIAQIQSRYGLPNGSIAMSLTDNYGSYTGVYLYTSFDGRLQCAMVSTGGNSFGVNCNAKPLFSIQR